MSRKTKIIAPVSPGEMLEEEFLVPLAMSKYHLAKSIGVPVQRINDIVSGKRGINRIYRVSLMGCSPPLLPKFVNEINTASSPHSIQKSF
jgi:hypothetical protein